MNKEITQSDVTAAAEMIARFLGWDVNEEDGTFHNGKTDGKLAHLNFHGDWNMLMPVVNEIMNSKYCNNFCIENKHCFINCNEFDNIEIGSTEKDLISIVWEGVYEFCAEVWMVNINSL